MFDRDSWLATLCSSNIAPRARLKAVEERARFAQIDNMRNIMPLIRIAAIEQSEVEVLRKHGLIDHRRARQIDIFDLIRANILFERRDNIERGLRTNIL